MAAGTPWPVVHRRGRAGDLHGRALPEPFDRAIWWLEVTGPAVVLGSTQPDDVVDADRAAAEGVEVARRRSGGGAVWLSPATVTWIDVLLPAADPRWEPDVSRSARWLGAAWTQALGALGVVGARHHEGPMVRTRWSDRVCFAGLAPGEVTVDGRKVVGISQRRTRHGARFQCAALHMWDPAPLAEVLRFEVGERPEAIGELQAVAVGLDELAPPVVSTAVVAALVDALAVT